MFQHEFDDTAFADISAGGVSTGSCSKATFISGCGAECGKMLSARARVSASGTHGGLSTAASVFTGCDAETGKMPPGISCSDTVPSTASAVASFFTCACVSTSCTNGGLLTPASAGISCSDTVPSTASAVEGTVSEHEI